MHELDLILTLTGSLGAALALGYLTHRLGLSPIVGYLLAGVAVSSNTPGFVADSALAGQMAEIGVILLMFGVGLHFQLKELLAVRRIAIPGSLLQSLFATALGAAAGAAAGWGWTAGVVYGLAVSVASTVVLTRVLADNDDLHTPAGHIAVGWLVMEDLFTVLILVLLPAMFGSEAADTRRVPLVLGLALLKVVALIAFTVLVGTRLIPWLLRRVAATQSRELFTLTVLVLALGIAVGSSLLFGVSMALGAFLAGMVVGRSDFSLRAASEALPMRDAFAVLFFVSVGMLLDLDRLLEQPQMMLATAGIVLVGKPAAALVIVLLGGYPLRTALVVSVALAQIGEFSFLLAAVSFQLGVLPEAANHALVAAAIVSISLNPLLYRLIDPLQRWAARRPRLRRWVQPRAPASATLQELEAAESEPALGPGHRAIVVGYGPVGRTVTRLLRANGMEPTILEMNLDTVRALRAEGLPAVYGNAGQRESLEGAGVRRAGTLILSASGMRDAAEVIRVARELNPEIRVLARAAYLHERPALHLAGADQVFSGEGEVALAMTESILRELGATPEQIDRERERLHAELFGSR